MPRGASRRLRGAAAKNRTIGPPWMDRAARASGRRLEASMGGRLRSQVIILLAAVLAMSSADTATVGAAATQLRSALHISNFDIGLLVSVTSIVGAVASIPFGIVADRFKRTRVLAVTVLIWGIATLWSASVGTFHELLLARVFLGLVTASGGPITASLVGDYFAPGERGKIYGYILTGELLGAGVGFAITGDLASISWRLAFIVLAIPTFILARYVFRLPEPVRGAEAPLPDEGSTSSRPGPTAATEHRTETDAQRLAREKGIYADRKQVLGAGQRKMGAFSSFRYVLKVRSNLLLIISSSFGYFYLAGVQTFGVEFAKQQYHVAQSLATTLLLVLGVGAVIGTLTTGRLSDLLLGRGYINSRVIVTGVLAAVATALFVPAFLTHASSSAVPYLVIAALGLAGQNPPIDAARLDILPSYLWGRAEGLRTGLRTAAQALAPLVFGAIADNVAGGGHKGLEAAFLSMLVTLAASSWLLFRTTKHYPRDVATAAASMATASETSYDGGFSPYRTRPDNDRHGGGATAAWTTPDTGKGGHGEAPVVEHPDYRPPPPPDSPGPLGPMPPRFLPPRRGPS